ncbi:hypothetical protein [Pontibacter virosus]|uniref:Uncharacterized protein n=1 Tax=Pontibacter virosus TaxID=1765052 RepID=A0A2U1AZJ5_9BACT|nr:hypothetical protein [Pontibacter virosus]PVY41845.1 hypothetical protein C8E01_104217 [Pontibacter virosus]
MPATQVPYFAFRGFPAGINQQTEEAYTYLRYKKESYPVAEELADTSLGLPLFPGMMEAEQDVVVTYSHTFFERHD